MSENDCAGLRGHKLKAKKDGTNFLLFVPGGQWRKLLPTLARSGGPLSITGISTPYYRFRFEQIQKSKFSRHAVFPIFWVLGASDEAFGCLQLRL